MDGSKTLALGGQSVTLLTEKVLSPPGRRHEWRDAGHGAAFEGMREVISSRYLTLLVFVVVAYEFTATLSDFGINVVFERSFKSEGELTQMYGRLGWIASLTAVISQMIRGGNILCGVNSRNFSLAASGLFAKSRVRRRRNSGGKYAIWPK